MLPIPMPTASAPTLTQRYQTMLADKGWVPDAAQTHAVVRFQHLATALMQDTDTPPKGLYFYGPVGRGKSMVMELFYQSITLPKRRVHFHAFMNELHHRLHTTHSKPGQDLMQLVARQFADEATLMCFDEFYITNIADAMLLGRLFQALFKEGVVVVATSNWAMEDLFQGGVNRDRFMPFVKLMKQYLEPLDIGDGRDYRVSGEGLPPYYIVAKKGDAARPQLEVVFQQFANGAKQNLPLELTAPKRHEGRAVWFMFEALCDKSYGREHYLELARAVDTLVLENVPVFTPTETDAAIRLITLIDIWYEHKRRLVISAADDPRRLCPQGDAAEPFKRCASRMLQLTSQHGVPETAKTAPRVVVLPSARVRKSVLSSRKKKKQREK